MELNRFDFTKYRLENGINHVEAAKRLGIRLASRIVSARHIWDQWPIEDWHRVMAARARYEDGVSEICQGRFRDQFILYEIPRKVKTAPRRYFSRWGNGIEPQ